MPTLPPSNIRTSVRKEIKLPEFLCAAIQQYADDSGESFSSAVRTLCRNALTILNQQKGTAS